MKGGKRRRGKTIEVITPYNEITVHNGCGNFTETITRQSVQMNEKSERVLDGKCVQASPSTEAGKLSELGNVQKTSAKIKLQLFPINESTCLGLEKDGYNPYLELTVNARKKMSSILRHLNNKWGNSGIALGEPMLFPYNTVSKSPASCRKWTLKDNDICAVDVYVAIGKPTVFRLGYGWFSEFESKTSEFPCSLTALEGASQLRAAGKGCEQEKTILIDATSAEPGQIIESKAMGTLGTGEMSSDAKDDEMMMDNNLPPAPAAWDDALTCLSVGALLDEASLQAKSGHNNTVSEPVQPIPDSLDAVSAQTMPLLHPQSQVQSSLPLTSSILDAEETCHGFAFPNLSSSSNDRLSLSRNYSGAGGSSFKSDILSCSHVSNVESSLGLADIKWNDSLGPFDLGLSSFQMIDGDNVSNGLSTSGLFQ